MYIGILNGHGVKEERLRHLTTPPEETPPPCPDVTKDDVEENTVHSDGDSTHGC